MLSSSSRPLSPKDPCSFLRTASVIFDTDRRPGDVVAGLCQFACQVFRWLFAAGWSRLARPPSGSLFGWPIAARFTALSGQTSIGYFGHPQ